MYYSLCHRTDSNPFFLFNQWCRITLTISRSLIPGIRHSALIWCRVILGSGIPEKLINLVKVMYSYNQCAVLHGDGTSNFFTLKSGVKQGCNMSGFLFFIIMDWIMDITTKNYNYGIRWKFASKLDGLDYADDIAFLSSSKQHIERKTEILDTTSRSTGLITNSAKNKSDENEQHKSPTYNHQLKGYRRNWHFYLSATVSKEGGTDKEIRRRLGYARVAYNNLHKIWSGSQLSRRTKGYLTIRPFSSPWFKTTLVNCSTFAFSLNFSFKK